MGKYKDFIANKSVADVFWCVVWQERRIKDIQEKLKQPQSTISEKMSFLVEEGVIIKDKWDFKPNWEKIVEISRGSIKRTLESFVIPHEISGPSKKEIKEVKDDIEEFMKFFDKDKIKDILTSYASDCYTGSYADKCLSEVLFSYFDGLCQTDDKDLKQLDPRLLKMKKRFRMSTMEKFLFTTVEITKIQKRLLFICHSNQNRSPTAERIFSKEENLSVKSAGLYEGSKRFVSEGLIFWADTVFVMEEYQKTELLRRFPEASKEKDIIVLGIEDVYDYMDPRLIPLLKKKVKDYL